MPRQVEEYYQMMNVPPMQIQSMNPNLQMQQQMQFSSKIENQPVISPEQIKNMKNPYG